MGFDVDTMMFGPGILMECTNDMCFQYLCKLLEKRGLTEDLAQEITTECFEDGNASLTGELLEFGDVHNIFSRLRGSSDEKNSLNST